MLAASHRMWLGSLYRRLSLFLRRDRFAAELEEEMRLHLDLRARALEQDGLPAERAHGAARRQFGNPLTTAERSQEAWGFANLDRLRQDVRFAARRLRQRPGFSVPVIAVVALGIGATTAVFSAIDAALLRPLPFARPHELVTLPNVRVPSVRSAGDRSPPRAPDILDAAELREYFASVAAFASGGLNLADPERPERVRAGVVTAGFFRTLGVTPLSGRTFSEAEGSPGGPHVAVLSHAFWRRRFGSADVIGRVITLYDRRYTIVGVMRAGFSFPGESDLWIPMTVPTTEATFEPFSGYPGIRVIARLAPGVPVEAASARLLTTWQQLVIRLPRGRMNIHDDLERVSATGPVEPLRHTLVGGRDRALLVLLAATTLLLLIACANVANLLLSDASARRREIAVRQVLGATSRRIARQLLVESLLLSLTGALVGLALAPAALGLLRVMLPEGLAGVAAAQLDGRVLAFCLIIALAVGIAFGVWPALAAARGDAAATIKSGGSAGSTTTGLGRVRRALVVAEVALTAVLLIGAGLMLRSFDRLMSEELGMEPEQVATLEISFSRADRAAERLEVLRRITGRLDAQPGIVAAAVVRDLPLRDGGGFSVVVDIDGLPRPRRMADMRMARYLMATGDYFRALGIPLLRGRVYAAAGDSLVPREAVIGKSMADRWWPNADPVGRTFRVASDTAPYTIVGVVGDVRELRMDQDPEPQMYLPIGGEAQHYTVVVRGTLPPSTLFARMTDAVRDASQTLPAYNLRMMEEVIGTSVAPRRTNTVLLALFAALALVLAALGVYAVVAYGVEQRRRELGIRSALGASGSDLLALVSLEMMRIVGLGLAIGLTAAWGASRVLAALLYEVDVHDFPTFAAVPVVLMVPALLATLVPAWRATRVSPVEVMRAD